MSNIRDSSENIRRFIIDNVAKHPRDIASLVASHFEMSRQAANKHLQHLVAELALTEEGQTRNKVYKLTVQVEWHKVYEIKTGLAEDLVWRQDVKPVLGNLPDNVEDIWYYGFTEMFNNAIDHSAGSKISLQIIKTAEYTNMILFDDGIGIFKKIQNTLHLLDERHAVLELAKGKLTTDPKRHTGEGIFFTSRVFDFYNILSGGVYFSHDFAEAEDWILESHQVNEGTIIKMRLNNHTARTLKKIFDKYAPGDEFAFNRTVVPVKLAQYSEDKLISRSQAKRLLARIELFKVVVFDFNGVDLIGQAFADEIFRVFANQHPEIELSIIHANNEVAKMVQRAKSNIL